VIEFVIEAMVDAVLVVDAEGRITMANSGAARLTGYPLETLRGMSVSTLLVDDSSGLRTVVRRRIEDGDVLRREDAWIIAQGGERIPVSVTGSPVLDNKSELQGIVLVARDVREMRELLAAKESEIARRRIAEDELRAAKASIEEQLQAARNFLLLAERRATLGTLAGGVGHELRNIAQIQLAAVEDLAEALAGQVDLLETATRIRPELDRVGEHITAHGNRLLQLARPGPDRVAPLDLHEIVRDVAAMLKLAGKLVRVGLVLELWREPITLTVNRTRLEQILVNLVINAVDAMGGTGRVVIRTRISDDGRRAICEVSDNGSGITADVLAKIFEPFFTTKGERGTGLGLPVCKEIVESYGGTLDVETEVGRGTTFRFDLPR